MKRVFVSAFLVALLSSCANFTRAASNLVLNGSFETNGASSTVFNLPNLSVGGYIAHATGFGTAEEIDLIKGGDNGVSPQDGNWKLGLHTQINPGQYDAFSVALSQPLVTGRSYALSFYAAASPIDGARGNFSVGVSTSATSFGTGFIGDYPPVDAWGYYTTTIVAPFAATHLTVQNGGIGRSYTSVDNFSLSQVVPEPRALGLVAAALLGFCIPYRRHNCLSLTHPSNDPFDDTFEK